MIAGIAVTEQQVSTRATFTHDRDIDVPDDPL
jgi:hypothetical protein